jgi:hypothetical protein
MKRSLLCALALSLAAPAVAQGPRPVLYITGSLEDRAIGNPFIPVDPLQASTFYLRAKLEPDQRITGLTVGLTTTTPGLADCGPGMFFNPTLPLPAGPGVRWGSTTPGSCSATGGVGSTGVGIDSANAFDDPLYDLDSDSFLVGSFQLIATNMPGAVKIVSMSAFAQGTDGGGALPALRLGAGEMTPGTNSLPDMRLGIRDPAELRGDYDGNGAVDARDYVLWRDTLGSTSDLRADGDGNGTVDETDYSFWRGNYGATGPGPFRARPLNGTAEPTAEVVDEGATPGGNRAYRLRIATPDPVGSLAVELAVEGPFVDVLRLGHPLHRESRADANDGLDGYQKVEDTWYVDSVFEERNPGDDPFAGTTSYGFAPRTAQGELFAALGSGAAPGPTAELLRLVLPPGQQATYEMLVAQGGEFTLLQGSIPAPEPAGGVAAAAILVALARRRQRGA